MNKKQKCLSFAKIFNKLIVTKILQNLNTLSCKNLEVQIPKLINDENIIFSKSNPIKLILHKQTKNFNYLLYYSHDRLNKNGDEYLLIKRMLNKFSVKKIYVNPSEEVNSKNTTLNNLY